MPPNSLFKSIGDHVLQAEASQVAGEIDIADNSMNALLTVNEEQSETVTITKAEFTARKALLKVESTSSAGGSVTLTVVHSSTGYIYGDMTYDTRKASSSSVERMCRIRVTR
ncbi:MAG: hypothetical protein CMM60_03805 [Rhodospirillaceae bacterium]|nr:hypothetical protein [Rhodospirillaceae bacterium]